MKSLDGVVGDMRSRDQPDARQQVDCPGLLGRIWRNHTASSRPQAAETTPRKSQVRGCSDQWCGKSGVDSRTTAIVNRTTATVNRSALRLTPRKQEHFQSVARGVTKIKI